MENESDKSYNSDKNHPENGHAQPGRNPNPFSIQSILGLDILERDSSESEERSTSSSSSTCSSSPHSPEKASETTPITALQEFTCRAFEGSSNGKRKNSDEGEALTLDQKIKLFQHGTRGGQKRRRKARTCFTNHQIYELERRFLYQRYLSPQDRDEISDILGLSCAQVITWFQNRRAKLKRDIEELRNDVHATAKLHLTAHERCMEMYRKAFHESEEKRKRLIF